MAISEAITQERGQGKGLVGETTQIRELLLGMKDEMSIEEMRQGISIADRHDFAKGILLPP